MNIKRVLCDAQRDQAWASMRSAYHQLRRILGGDERPDDRPLIRRACSIVVTELEYRAAIAAEEEV